MTDRLTATATHESAHAMLLLRWFPLVRLQLLDPAGGEVHHLVTDERTDGWGVVLAGGYIAEKFLGVSLARRNRASRRDRERMEKLLDVLGVEHPRQRAARLKSWERGAARLLRRRWHDVAAIAKALIARRCLDVAEVQRILLEGHR